MQDTYQGDLKSLKKALRDEKWDRLADFWYWEKSNELVFPKGTPQRWALLYLWLVPLEPEEESGVIKVKHES